jgi:hypothetical protein
MVVDSTGKVSIDIGSLVNDTSRDTHEHLLEDRYQTNEARDQNDETKEQGHTSSRLIITFRCSVLKKAGQVPLPVSQVMRPTRDSGKVLVSAQFL